MILVKRWLVILIGLTMCMSAAVAADINAAPQQQESPQVQAMNQLVKVTLEQSLQLMIQAGKPIYPFALMQFKDGRVTSMTYKEQKDEEGNVIPQPSEAEWTEMLFVQLSQVATQLNGPDVAVLARMHEIEDEKGKKLKGIWVMVDHRDVRPWVVFMPLVQQKDGSLKPEMDNLVYYATDQTIFFHPDLEANPKAKAKK